MTNPLVRTHWISGAADFITAHYSSDAADRITNGLPAEVRAALARRDPDPWSPRAHHVSLMSAIVSAQRDEVAAFDDLMAYVADGSYVLIRYLGKVVNKKGNAMHTFEVALGDEDSETADLRSRAPAKRPPQQAPAPKQEKPPTDAKSLFKSKTEIPF